MPYFNVDDKSISITHIPREDNQRADLLSKLVSFKSIELPTDVQVEVLEEPNVDKNELIVVSINITNDWSIPIRNYL